MPWGTAVKYTCPRAPAGNRAPPHRCRLGSDRHPSGLGGCPLPPRDGNGWNQAGLGSPYLAICHLSVGRGAIRETRDHGHGTTFARRRPSGRDHLDPARPQLAHPPRPRLNNARAADQAVCPRRSGLAVALAFGRPARLRPRRAPVYADLDGSSSPPRPPATPGDHRRRHRHRPGHRTPFGCRWASAPAERSALAAANSAAARVFEALKKAGVDDKDQRTSGVRRSTRSTAAPGRASPATPSRRTSRSPLRPQDNRRDDLRRGRRRWQRCGSTPSAWTSTIYYHCSPRREHRRRNAEIKASGMPTPRVGPRQPHRPHPETVNQPTPSPYYARNDRGGADKVHRGRPDQGRQPGCRRRGDRDLRHQVRCRSVRVQRNPSGEPSASTK